MPDAQGDSLGTVGSILRQGHHPLDAGPPEGAMGLMQSARGSPNRYLPLAEWEALQDRCKSSSVPRKRHQVQPRDQTPDLVGEVPDAASEAGVSSLPSLPSSWAGVPPALEHHWQPSDLAGMRPSYFGAGDDADLWAAEDDAFAAPPKRAEGRVRRRLPNLAVVPGVAGAGGASTGVRGGDETLQPEITVNKVHLDAPVTWSWVRRGREKPRVVDKDRAKYPHGQEIRPARLQNLTAKKRLGALLQLPLSQSPIEAGGRHASHVHRLVPPQNLRVA